MQCVQRAILAHSTAQVESLFTMFNDLCARGKPGIILLEEYAEAMRAHGFEAVVVRIRDYSAIMYT